MSRSAGSFGAGGAGRFVDRVIPAYVLVATVAVATATGLAVRDGLAPGHEGSCVFHVGAALSGSAAFFDGSVAPGCAGLTAAAARAAVAWDFAFIAVYGLGWTALLRWLWPRAWRVSSVRGRKALPFLPLGAAVVDVVENVFVLRALPEGGVLSLSGWTAAAAGMAGWWKWLLVALSFVVTVAAIVSAVANAGTPQPPPRAPRPPVPPEPARPPLPVDLGICLSGGGIRSASFATGALRALDRRKVFMRARWIAAVSGGAYAAGAWFIGRGSASDAPSGTPQPAEGRDRFLDSPANAPGLFAYLRKNRRYLATGRGGIAANLLVGALLVAFNVFVLGVLLCLVAWPAGRFVSSWLVQPDLRLFDYEDVEVQSLWVDARLWRPGLAGLAASLVPAAASLFLWEARRGIALRVAAALAGGGALLLTVLVAVPVALAEAPKGFVEMPVRGVTGGAALVGLVVAAGAAGALATVVARPMARNALRLGGVLVGILALLFAGKVATDAAYGAGAFAWSPRTYAGVAAGFGAFCLVANPQAWSLFRIYYLRLRSTFATTKDPGKRAAGAPGHKGVYPLSLEAEADWPAYSGRSGPKLLVCAAAQRNSDGVTGVPALPFTFSDEAVAMHEIEADDTETETWTIDHLVDPAEYVTRLRRPGPWGPRLGSVSAAVAMSGAAFTSAMGRQSLGTTNALLAALNVRLGVWMPNPRYAGSGPSKRPRLTYLLKEIFGLYDLDDPYVYVTDGGHWENLGLVELVRRRCKWIFCLDASGDKPDSFETLEQAKMMAWKECGAEIDLDPAKLRKPEHGLPERAVEVGLVRYHTCGGLGEDACDVGVVFYGKAMLAKDSPINVLSFSLRDRIYPRYPTYDQFLAADQFDNLVRLGEWIGRGVALEYERVVRALSTHDEEPLRDTPRLLEAYRRDAGRYEPPR